MDGQPTAPLDERPVDPVRSRIMAAIRGKDTKPELLVRRLAHALGYRYRIHVRKLPGTPDLVFGPRKLAVFVHGCFWHRHEGCCRATLPGTRTAFWREKFERNVARDHRNQADLEARGWRVEVIWECETRDKAALKERIEGLLGPRPQGTGTANQSVLPITK